jgi:hypothetical protein
MGTENKNIEKILVYGIFGFFLFLIVNWLLNTKIVEGVENKNPPNAAVKCPESCTSVTELQKKLSDSVKRVETLEQSIVQNTNSSQAHATSISDLNKALDEMQKNQKDE